MQIILHPDDKFHQKKGDNIFSFFLVSLFPYFEMCVLNEKKKGKQKCSKLFFHFQQCSLNGKETEKGTFFSS